MLVRTYITLDNPNAVNKSLELVQEFECRALDPVDEIAPVLKFTKSDYNMTANYCYIDAFKMYYFINDKILSDGGIITLQCSIDPLFSMKDELLNCSCVVIRNENIGSNDIVDDKLPINPNESFLELVNTKLVAEPAFRSGFFVGVF